MLSQIARPFVASSAMTFILLSTVGVVMYMTPFTTRGVVSKLAVIPVWAIPASTIEPTLPESICLSGE